MKKWFLLAAVAVLALPALAQQQEAFPSYIQVTGRSEMEVAPDEFYLSIVIDEKDSKGKISVESQQRQMIDALRRLGVNVDKQLKVANLSSEFFKRRNSVATAKYQLQLGTAEMVSRVYEALDRVGISNISIQKVSHSQLEQLKQQVRVEAIRDAKRNAQTLAQAIGQQIGKCFYIYDSNNDVLPVVFQQGSLGASGDLAPLANMCLPLLGLGEVEYKGARRPSDEVLKEFGWKPISLQSKEGLALLNGTQFMSAFGVYSLIKARRLSEWADLIGAMSLDAFDGRINPFIDEVQDRKSVV